MTEILALRGKRTPFPIPQSACRIIYDLGFNEPRTSDNVVFSLRRSRCGVDIHFVAPISPTQKFSWSVTNLLDLKHSTFAEARKWIAGYAARYGQTVEEAKKERCKRPTGQARKDLKAGICREEWLASDIPQLWAEAQVRCQHAGGFCGEDGFCHYGDCDMIMAPVTGEVRAQ